MVIPLTSRAKLDEMSLLIDTELFSFVKPLIETSLLKRDLFTTYKDLVIETS